MTSRELCEGVNSTSSLINLNSKQDVHPNRRGESIETFQSINNSAFQNDLHKLSVLTQPNENINHKNFNESENIINEKQKKIKIMTLRSLHELIYEIYSSKIKYDQKYFVFSEAKKRGLLVLDSNKNAPYIGNCWPSKSSWIDYFNP